MYTLKKKAKHRCKKIGLYLVTWLDSFRAETRRKRQRDLNFNNTVFLCQHSDCNQRYFRLYQVMSAYKLQKMAIPGDPNPNELEYSESMTPELFHELGLVRCPHCHNWNVERAEKFDWMRNAEAFPELTRKQLARHRKNIYDPKGKKRLLKTLRGIETHIKEIDGIAAYQLQQGLPSIDSGELDITSTIQSIQEQLALLGASTHHRDVQLKARKLSRLLDRPIMERLRKPIRQNPAPCNLTRGQRLEQEWTIELEKTIYQLKKWLETNEREGSYHTSSHHEVRRLTQKYIDMTQETEESTR